MQEVTRGSDGVQRLLCMCQFAATWWDFSLLQEASRLLHPDPTLASKLTHVCSVFAVFTCLFHALRRHRGCLGVPLRYCGGLSCPNSPGSLGMLTRSFEEKWKVAAKIYQGQTANRHVEPSRAERAPCCGGGINHTGRKHFHPCSYVCLVCDPT